MTAHRSGASRESNKKTRWGPLFFCLAWQRVVEKLPPSLKINVWYLDDGHLVGTPDDLIAASKIISEEGAKLGIKVNAAKCRVWGPAADGLKAENPTSLWASYPRAMGPGYGPEGPGSAGHLPGHLRLREGPPEKIGG